MARVVEFRDTVFTVDLYKAGRTNNEYDCILLEGSWPSDEDIIILCDGGDPGMPKEEILCSSGEVFITDEKEKLFVRVFK